VKEGGYWCEKLTKGHKGLRHVRKVRGGMKETKRPPLPTNDLGTKDQLNPGFGDQKSNLLEHR